MQSRNLNSHFLNSRLVAVEEELSKSKENARRFKDTAEYLEYEMNRNRSLESDSFVHAVEVESLQQVLMDKDNELAGAERKSYGIQEMAMTEIQRQNDELCQSRMMINASASELQLERHQNHVLRSEIAASVSKPSTVLGPSNSFITLSFLSINKTVGNP